MSIEWSLVNVLILISWPFGLISFFISDDQEKCTECTEWLNSVALSISFFHIKSPFLVSSSRGIECGVCRLFWSSVMNKYFLNPQRVKFCLTEINVSFILRVSPLSSVHHPNLAVCSTWRQQACYLFSNHDSNRRWFAKGGHIASCWARGRTAHRFSAQPCCLTLWRALP